MLKTRARFVLSTMAKLGTKVMAAGPRDLSAGAGFLKTEAKKAGIVVLSANLREGDAPVFDGSATLTVNGVKVALIGLTNPGPQPAFATLTATPTLEAVKTELAKLPRRDLTVILAATSYADAQMLATELKGRVDVVIQSGEFRGTQPPQNFDPVYVLASGQKGQSVAKLELALDGTGPIVDRGQSDLAKQQLDFIDLQLRSLGDRLKLATDTQAMADLKRMIDEMKVRRDEQAATANAPIAKGARSLKQEWIVLDSKVADDAALKAEVLKIDPAYSGTH